MPEDGQEFELQHPPLIEAVLAVQFLPLAKWSLPHFGLFWQTIRSEYPRFELQQPIVAPESAATGTLFGARLWFIDESDTRVLQVQNDRIVMNWRKRGEASYPRYQIMRPQMDELLQHFLRFLEQEDLGTLQGIRCDFSYVNHIDLEDLMSDGATFADLFPYWQGGATDFLKDGSTLLFSNTISLPGNGGILTVAIQPAVSSELGKAMMQLTFSTTVVPQSLDAAGILTALDLARSWDLQGFKEFTSIRAQEKWGRRYSL